MRRVFGFAWRFALAYSVLVVLWVTVLEPRYNDALALVCTRVLAAIEEPPLTTGIERDGNFLVVHHLSRFGVEPQRIVTRRVHSNTALFAALTLATPGTGWAARGLWLAGGGALLAVSHAAHVLAYVHHHYALYNVGPYFSRVRPAESARLGWRETWSRPATFRRDLALTVAGIFNVVLQRVVPIALWLPLFLAAMPRRAGAGAQARRGGRAVVLPFAAALVLVAGSVALALRLRAGAPPPTVEGIRPGTSALAAKRLLDQHGYDWTPRAAARRRTTDLQLGMIDAWPRHGPLLDRRYGPRYNWIGLHLAIPRESSAIGATCVTGIATVPSDERPERHDFASDDPAAACNGLWASLAPAR